MQNFEFDSICHTLIKRATETPNSIAYTFVFSNADAINITYSELYYKASMLAGYLKSNFSRKDRIVLLFKQNGFDFIITFFACGLSGMIAVPLPIPENRHAIDRLKAVILDAAPAAIATTKDVHREVWSRIPSSVNEKRILVDDLFNSPSKADDNSFIGEESLGDIAFLQYTSGSTGMPKGVIVTHKNIMANLRNIKTISNLCSKDRSVSWLPFFHDMGLIDGVLEPMYSGFQAILMSPFAFIKEPKFWLETISKYKATRSGGPNFSFAFCNQRITDDDLKLFNLTSLKTMYCGAEPIKFETIDEFINKFSVCGFDRKAFMPAYGLAEFTLMASLKQANTETICARYDYSISAVTDSFILGDKITKESNESVFFSVGSCSKKVGNTEILIVDPDSKVECVPNKIGEIWLYGDSKCAGYWNRDELAQETFEAKVESRVSKDAMYIGDYTYLRTGDLGLVYNNQLYVTGRIKELIIMRGKNYYPQDIEDIVQATNKAFRKNFGVAFSFVDGNGVEKLCIVQEIIQKQARHLKADDYRDMVKSIKANLAKHMGLLVDHIAFVKFGYIPKTTSGKLQRSLMKKMYIEGKSKDYLFDV